MSLGHGDRAAPGDDYRDAGRTESARLPTWAIILAETITLGFTTDTSLPTVTSNSITVTGATGAITLSPSTLPTPTVGVAYSQQLTASGGSGSGYVFTAAGLPAGLTLSPGGLLSGVPTVAGSFTIDVTVTDGDDDSATFDYDVTVTAQTPAGQIVLVGTANVFR